MQTGHHYPALQVLAWTRRDILQHLAVATMITVAYAVLGWRWLAIPWLPVALLGTAVAFLTSFKNNASYDRLWEARRIWGAIVNASRTWGMMARDYVTDRVAAGTRTGCSSTATSPGSRRCDTHCVNRGHGKRFTSHTTPSSGVAGSRSMSNSVTWALRCCRIWMRQSTRR
jgi:Bestrophin, RFP-TM, chloride channel